MKGSRFCKRVGGYTPWTVPAGRDTLAFPEVPMTEIPHFELVEMSGRAALLHDLRHALFAIHLAPLLLEKHREDERRFHEICESLSKECESIAGLIEEEFGDVGAVRSTEGGGKTEKESP